MLASSASAYNKWDSGNHTTAKVWPYAEGYSTCHYGQ